MILSVNYEKYCLISYQIHHRFKSITEDSNTFKVNELPIQDSLILGDMNCFTRFVLHAYMVYVFLPESYVSKYILIRLEDFAIEHPVYSPNHEDLDYPEPQEKMQVPSKDGKHNDNVNGRRLNQQNIKSSFRMLLKALSRSIDGT